MLEREPVRVRATRCSPASARGSSRSSRRPGRASSTATARPTWRARSCRSAASARAATTGRRARGRTATSCTPVAVLENPLGAVTPHPHARRAPARRSISIGSSASTRARRPRRPARRLVDAAAPDAHRTVPRGGRLPQSEALLARLYAGDRVPKEKKPPVFDHLRSAGPWMVSVDDEPLAVIDGMSQTATVVGGFAEDPVVRAYTEGEFADTLVANDDTSARRDLGRPPTTRTTLRQLVPGLPHVTFVARGAEANEKAMALCRINCRAAAGDEDPRVRGQLPRPHAARAPRDPLAEQARAVRARRLPGARSRRSRCGPRRTGDEPTAPSGFYAAAATGDIAELAERFGDAQGRSAARGRGRIARRRPRGARDRRLLLRDHRADAERGWRSLRDRAVLPRAAAADPPPQDVPGVRRGPGRLRPRRAVRVALEVPAASTRAASRTTRMR